LLSSQTIPPAWTAGGIAAKRPRIRGHY